MSSYQEENLKTKPIVKTVNEVTIHLVDDRFAAVVNGRYRQASSARALEKIITAVLTPARGMVLDYRGAREILVTGYRPSGHYGDDFLNASGSKIKGVVYVYDQEIVDELTALAEEEKLVQAKVGRVQARAIRFTRANLTPPPPSAPEDHDGANRDSQKSPLV